MATCPNCGKELPEGTKFCGYCGYNFENAQPAASQGYAAPQGYAPAPEYGGYQPAPVPAVGKSPMMIVGMILSILALVLCFVSTILLANLSVNASFALSCGAFVASIVGVVLSAKGKHKSGSGRGMGTAGLVVGIIAIVYSSILLIIFFAAYGFVSSNTQNVNRIINELNNTRWY